jgi:hypothetical protein
MTATLDAPDTSETKPAHGRHVVAALGLAVLIAGGVLILGNLAPNATVAMAITTVFFGAVALGLLLVVRRHRDLLIPLAATYLIVVGGAGAWLGLPLLSDNVVSEDVVRVEAPAAPAAPADASAPTQAAPAASPVALASGQFTAQAHPGEGDATLIDTGDGVVVTLTDFATDNGPDLFVHLVPPDAPAGSVDGGVNLGKLKGNIGDQQYAVPDGLDAGAGWRVVVWCRAFTVTFTEAVLG